MDFNTALALTGATAILVTIPGPNVALFIANTIAYGARFGVATVLGTTLGVALQLLIVVLGLAALLEFASSAFGWLKWAGVVYLIYLGIVSWRQGVDTIEAPVARCKPMRVLFQQGLLLAMINPKTLLFTAAFLPQFVNTQAAGPFSLMVPAIIYLSVVLLGDLCWVACAQIARPAIMKLGRLRHRLTGCLFIGSGVGLALARVDR